MKTTFEPLYENLKMHMQAMTMLSFSIEITLASNEGSDDCSYGQSCQTLHLSQKYVSRKSLLQNIRPLAPLVTSDWAFNEGFYAYAWVEVFRIIPEFRILRLTFHRKSASKCRIREITTAFFISFQIILMQLII